VSEDYRSALARVTREGAWSPTPQGPRAKTLMQVTMKFPLADGFPVITERDVSSFWQKPINELCAFINGVTTADGLREFGCEWWDLWTTEEKTVPLGLAPGDLGPGSYGGAFKYFPTADGEPFDQMTHLVEQLKERPDVRTHFVSPWIPQFQARGVGKRRRAVVSPCHGWVHVRVLGGRLHLHMFQRSGDVPIGVPANMIQYAALLLMLEQVTGLEAHTYYHTISDAHIYEDQMPAVQTILERDPRQLPTVQLTAEGKLVTELGSFRGHHFELSDYVPHGALRIPVAV